MGRRTWVLRGALVALLAILSVAATGFGGATPVTRAADGPQSVNFNCLGAPQYFSVPTGVTSITVVARGASGRNDNNDSPGRGATIQGTMTVVPGQTYRITVGCTTSYGWANGGGGGDASSGIGADGASGGGATGIVLDGTSTPVLVAGGGGGSGGHGFLIADGGGAGGNAGITAGNGGGGTGAGAGGGGAGGGSNGPDGVAGEEAHTASSGGGGGGGGGGYTKGGARGAGGDAGAGGGGGGGAGMSYAAPALAGATIATAASAGDGIVTLSYTGPDGLPQIFRCTGVAVDYVVPANVHTLLVVASGAQGGTIPRITSAGAGGRGDVRVATIAVTPGETLQVVVGCVGTPGEVEQHCAPGGGVGGFGLISGGKGGAGDGDCIGINGDGGGSGGGGSSGITAGFPPDDTTDVLLMAGGGGGGGGHSFYFRGGNGGGPTYTPIESGGTQVAGNPGGGSTDACSGDGGGPGSPSDNILGLRGGDGGNATVLSSSGGGGGGGGGFPKGLGGGGGSIGICGGGGGASGGSLVGPGVQPLAIGPFRVLGNGDGMVMLTPLFADPKAASATTVTVSDATYDGQPHGGTAVAASPGGLNQPLTITYTGRNSTNYGPSTTAPTNAGDYTASAAFDGDDDYLGSSDSKPYTIAKATSTVTVTANNATFDNNTHGGTATVTGAGNLNQAVTPVTYTGRNATIYGPSTIAPTNAGDYTASASYAGDANHNSSMGSKDYVINKASSTTTVTATNATYNNNPYAGASASVTGAGGLNQAVTPITYSGRNGTTYGPSTTAPTNAGSYTASASYAGDTNHNGSTGSKDYVINKAPSTTTVTASNITYTGSPYTGATATATGAGNLSVPVTPLTYTGRNGTTYGPSTTAPTNAGDYTASASFPGDANHTGSSGSATFTIARAPTTIGPVRGDVVYGDTSGTATATLRRADNAAPVAGATLAFTVRGQAACGGAGLPACPSSNAQGVAALAGARFPTGLNAGTQAGVQVCASFAGNTNYLPSGPVCSPLVVARRAFWVKPVDRTVGLKQPNPPTVPLAGCVAQATATAACWVELANGSTFVNGDDWGDLNLTNLRFQYSRNPPNTNTLEQVGTTYRITTLGITSANYEIHYLPGILTVK